ncbi:MAG TPA: hypothetical protein VG937_19200 [Polyangiaceae bacterium]|jgi:hypothetical protein|nr:hypothetical protein [Polyangiaceae bacterium]
MRGLGVRLFLLCFFGLLCGCGRKAVGLSEGPREYVATDYDTVLRHWTRSVELTNVTQMDNVLNVSSTYESWDFRWAYVVRYAEDYRLTIDQRHDLLERSLAETRDHHTFYVALYAEKYKWNDLTATQPAWIVRLIDDEGTETAPSEIEPIKRPGAIELTYFPYTTPWRSAFRVRFPKVRADGRPTISSAARWFGLRFAGAQGNDELVWEISAAN